MGKDLLVDGAVVHLWSKRSGKNLKIDDGANVTSTGRNGEYAQFIVHVKSGEVCFQNKLHSNHWLAIREGKIKGDGTGGPYTHFHVIDHGPGFISLESVQARGRYVGVNSDGDMDVKDQTSDHTKFYVIPVKPASGQAIPPGSRLLTDGAQVRLWSNAYGMNVRIQENGVVDGKGWSAFYALYTVHKHGEDVVRLQNVQKPDHWIAIKNNETTGIASGGKFTHLRVHDSENGMVCFESVEHPGQHLGVLSDGELKPPNSTGKGDHGRFHVLLC